MRLETALGGPRLEVRMVDARAYEVSGYLNSPFWFVETEPGTGRSCCRCSSSGGDG